MTDLAIETAALTRYFGDVHAVDNLSLRVPRGSVYGFLGPNGAGKTTTIRLLLGLTRPDRGDVRVFGEPIKRPACLPSGNPRLGCRSYVKWQGKRLSHSSFGVSMPGTVLRVMIALSIG